MKTRTNDTDVAAVRAFVRVCCAGRLCSSRCPACTSSLRSICRPTSPATFVRCCSQLAANNRRPRVASVERSACAARTRPAALFSAANAAIGCSFTASAPPIPALPCVGVVAPTLACTGVYYVCVCRATVWRAWTVAGRGGSGRYKHDVPPASGVAPQSVRVVSRQSTQTDRVTTCASQRALRSLHTQRPSREAAQHTRPQYLLTALLVRSVGLYPFSTFVFTDYVLYSTSM